VHCGRGFVVSVKEIRIGAADDATCFDADTESRLKDTVDVVLSKEEYDRIKEHPLNKTFTFHVREIRTGRGARFRFDCRLQLTPTVPK